MIQVAPWLALGSLASGAISLGFMRHIWRYRDRPGALYFAITIGCVALWSLAYGAALFVFDPFWRQLFEIPIWLAINFIGVFFLAFGLEYTGRGDLLRSKFMGAVIGIQSVHTLVVLTNPLHHVAWSNYAVTPVLGAATVTYDHQPWLFVNAVGVILLIGAACYLLSDTVFSYGPLYRKQAAAIAISPVFPGVPFLLWLIQVGGSPPLNLTPLLFSLHLVFDMYAFFSRNMFEMVPAARRVAERAAIDDLGSAVVIVDTDGRIIDLNVEARRVIGVGATEALGDALDSHLAEVDPTAEDQRQTVSLLLDGRRREYAVTTSRLEDSADTHVGYTLVLQDITVERMREQRLAVLNRVLRHNLRNDLNVVHGFLDIAIEEVDDDAVRDHLRTAESKTADVMQLGEKARDIERAIESEGTPVGPIDVASVLGDIVADLRDRYPSASIDLSAPADLTLRADELLLDRVFRNLMENGLEHNDAAQPNLDVEATADTEHGGVTVTVRDNGSGIPGHELEVLRATQETALEHGSGLGLWLVKWGVDALGGHIEFETDDGTTATIRFPDAALADAAR